MAINTSEQSESLIKSINEERPGKENDNREGFAFVFVMFALMIALAVIYFIAGW